MSRYKNKKNKSALDLSEVDIYFIALENTAENSLTVGHEIENFAARLYYLGHRLGRPNNKIMNGALDE